jgi:hypothetical protein
MLSAHDLGGRVSILDQFAARINTGMNPDEARKSVFNNEKLLASVHLPGSYLFRRDGPMQLILSFLGSHSGLSWSNDYGGPRRLDPNPSDVGELFIRILDLKRLTCGLHFGGGAGRIISRLISMCPEDSCRAGDLDHFQCLFSGPHEWEDLVYSLESRDVGDLIVQNDAAVRDQEAKKQAIQKALVEIYPVLARLVFTGGGFFEGAIREGRREREDCEEEDAGVREGTDDDVREQEGGEDEGSPVGDARGQERIDGEEEEEEEQFIGA